MMTKERRSIFICFATTKIVDAMEMIDKNARGILFVVSECDELIGCISDGDIRRWILKSGELTAPVLKAMNYNPKSLHIYEKDYAINFMYEKVINAVPLVDDNKRIVDIILLSDEQHKKIGLKKNLEGVPVVIMAGGQGTRLYPLTKILPKPLIPIGEIPIIERVIDSFAQYGIKKYYMTVNYKKGMIRSYFNDIDSGYDIVYVEEDRPLGTGGSIKLIKDKFDKPVIVTNCDTIIVADYADIYDYHLKSENVITMVSSLKNYTIPYGVIHFGENGELMDMEEKPKLSYFINTGMYIVNPEVIDLIPNDKIFHMPDLVEKVMALGGKVGTYPISEDSFLDMGEFSEMKRMEQKLNIISEN